MQLSKSNAVSYTHLVEMYGRLNNLLDQKYEEAFGYPALRLNFLTGIKISFPAEHGHQSP